MTRDPANVFPDRITSSKFQPQSAPQKFQERIRASAAGLKTIRGRRVITPAFVRRLAVTGAVADTDEQQLGDFFCDPKFSIRLYGGGELIVSVHEEDRDQWRALRSR